MKRSAAEEGGAPIDSEVPLKKPALPSVFLGRPLNKLDIDELSLTRDGQAPPVDARGRLAALNLAIPTTQKSLRVLDQVARDEQGRRRFHGAFTGGFSAGYFNTVGSEEGWTPSGFQSSRKFQADEGLHKRRLNAEDFMDEEDLENITSAGTRLSVRPERLVPKVIGDEFDVLFESRSGAEASLTVEERAATQGVRILRSMGWRSGNLVMGPVARRPPVHVMEASVAEANRSKELGVTERRKVIGPQVPSGFSMAKNSHAEAAAKKVISEKQANLDDGWSLRLQELTEGLRNAARKLKVLKQDVHGLGYSAEEGMMTFKGLLKQTRLNMTDHRKASSRGGFGIGVLEDDDDDDVYDFNIEGRVSKQQSVHRVEEENRLLALTEEPSTKNKKDQMALIAQGSSSIPREELYFFVTPKQNAMCEIGSKQASTLKSLLQEFSVKRPPTSWREIHRPLKEEKALLEKASEGSRSVISQLKQHLDRVAAERMTAQETKSVDQSTHKKDSLANKNIKAEEAIEDTKAKLLSKQKRDDDHKNQMSSSRPLWSRVTDDTKKALIGESFAKLLFTTASLISSSKFVKQKEAADDDIEVNMRFQNDIAKQQRYELFCLALDEKIPASVALSQSASLSVSDAAEERKEFGKCYCEFRSKFPLVQLPMRAYHAIKPEASALEKVVAKYTRVSFNWKPIRLLCRRFEVYDPWERKPFVNDRPESQLQGRAGSAFSAGETVRKAQSRSSAFVTGLVGLLDPEKTEKTPEVKLEQPRETPIKAPVEPPIEVEPIYPRPPMSIFKSVFGDDSDGEDD